MAGAEKAALQSVKGNVGALYGWAAHLPSTATRSARAR